MVINTILIILAVATSGSIYYFTGLYNQWWWIFLFIIAIPILYVIWFFIYLIPISIVSWFLSKKEEVKKPNMICYWFVRQTCYVVPHLFRAFFKKTGPDFPNERCLIVSNHTSNFDPMTIMWFTRNHPTVCVTKPENMDLPIAGPYIWKCGFIPIDRENDFNAVKSIVKAANNIKKDIASVYICPEGTRNHHPENGMLEWHAGSFKIAFKAQCPIVVVAQSNAHKIAKQFWYKHTNYYIDVVEIIPYEKYKDWNTQSLANYCKEIVQKKLEERS